MNGMDASVEPVESLRAFIEEQRTRCLWFLTPDYLPTAPDEQENVLRLIEQHGDQAAFRRAATFRRWLSLPSSARSAAS